MFKKVVILPTILLTLLCMTAFSVSAHSRKNKSQLKRAVADNFIYTQVLYLIDGFEKEAEKIRDEQSKNYLKNYFAGKADLNEEQEQILKTVARNYADAFYSASYKQRLKLSIQYRNELKTLFGSSEFNRFDNFVKKQIAPDVKIIRLKDGSIALEGGGSSGITLNESIHQLQGHSSTSFLSFARNQTLSCSVSAIMSGPNVSVSGSDSNNCSDNLSVTLLSSNYLPGSEYCVVGQHVVFSGAPTTSTACLTTPGAARVVKVEFEQILTDDLAIDANPNASGGLRIFPDKKDPMDTGNRKKIRVRAKYGTNTSGVRIYFRNFDLDDPSANSAPIDVESTLNAGDDNNGNVDGTMNTRAGLLSYTANPNPNDCQPYTYGVSCLTDTNGEATADFTVTMQPGDNFTVAASSDNTYLSGLTLAADGINLKDTANTQIPVTTNNNQYACSISSVDACRADMLTVWRRLHIEVDSMGNVTGNKVTGTFANSQSINTKTATLQVIVSPSLEINRFEKGRLNIGRRSYEIVENSTDSIKIASPDPFSITAGQSFTIYDDDDFNDNDDLNGDEGEDINEPDTSLLQPNDILCNGINATGCNVFVSSYVRPVYDITADKNNNGFFYLNVANDRDQIRATFGDFDQIGTQQSQEFWTIYLYGGYQGDTGEDSDPDDQNGDGVPHGCFDGTYGISDDIGPSGFGAIIFMENARPKEFPDDYLDRPVSRAWTAAHEVGHLMGGDHPEMGLMARSCVRTAYEFAPSSIVLFRKILNP